MLLPKQKVSVVGSDFHILLDRYKRDMAMYVFCGPFVAVACNLRSEIVVERRSRSKPALPLVWQRQA